MKQTLPLIEIKQLKKHYPIRNHNWIQPRKQVIKAIDELSLTIHDGEILGLVGGSGSGKTTLGEIILRLQKETAGKIIYHKRLLSSFQKKDLKAFRKNVQMIFQDPFETLNPKFTMYETVAEPLKIQGTKNKKTLYDRVILALERAELKPAESFLYRYPHELSGGQLQRIAIARAIVLEPSFLVADEPVSMLDVSVRAGVLNVLKKLQKDMGLTVLYISHDLSTVSYLCDRIAVMHEGNIVELGEKEQIIRQPQHPYTQELLSAIPTLSPAP